MTNARKVQIQLSLGDVTLRIKPASERIPLSGIVGIAQEISDAVTDKVESLERAAEREISYTKGCGACCRQFVPVSAPEASYLWNQFMAMDRPRQLTLEERLTHLRERVIESGIDIGKVLHSSDPPLRLPTPLGDIRSEILQNTGDLRGSGSPTSLQDDARVDGLGSKIQRLKSDPDASRYGALLGCGKPGQR